MPDDDKMSIDERRKYLRLVERRYANAKRAERSHLLKEMVEVTGLHRKSLLRLMHLPSLERAPKKTRFRRSLYGDDVADVVRVVWESLDYVCAERLTPVLLSTAQQLARWEELVLTDEVEEKLIAGPLYSGCCSVSSKTLRSYLGASPSHPTGCCGKCRWSG